MNHIANHTAAMHPAPVASPRLSLLALLALLFAVLSTSCSRPVPRLPSVPERTEPWSQEVVEQMASVPLQDNGRIKPLATLAAFTLYYVHGRRDLKYSTPGPDGSLQKITLEPTEWLLDVWCFPRQAADYALFRIEHTGVLDALGFANDGQRQDFDYLSYSQVYSAVAKLQELARSYNRIPQDKRDIVQEHVVQLWRKFLTYDRLQRQLGAFHYELPVEGVELQQAVGGAKVYLGTILQNAEGLRRMARQAEPSLEGEGQEGLVRLLDFVSKATHNDDDGARLIPPLETGNEKWHTLGEGVDLVVRGASGDTLEILTNLQDAIALESMAKKEAALLRYREAAVAAAAQHCDYGKVQLETGYYRNAWHYKSIHWFLLAFVLAAACWLMPRNKLLWWASMGVTGLALGFLTYDVVLRCLITDRPPIKNLYDTFLFIAAVGVLLSMVVEFVLPRRIALAAAPFLGALLVMFARMFEVSKGEDTMDPLIAVLDSNFWLATHVTTINIGYAAGLLAAVLANCWILMRVFRISHPDDAPAKALVRMTYGVTCFALAFAVVGTILGGVWANDSWGRFWGWDPKENGALLICLSQIALLHARMSGLVRDFGFIVWAALTGAIVVFSWFHVNLLGIGLHSYGFSSGLRDAVWICYVTQIGFVAVGAIDVLLRPNPARVTRSSAAGAPAAAAAS